MGRNTSASVDTELGIIRITTASAVSPGDFLMNRDAGSAASATNALTIAQQTVTTQGASQLISPIRPKTDNTYYSYTKAVYNCMAELGNSTVAYVFTGNGSSSKTSGLNLAIYTLSGNILTNKVIFTGGYIGMARVRKINSSTFAVTFYNQNEGKYYLQIFNNDGSQVGTDITVLNNGSGYFDQMGHNSNVLSNGNIVYAYTSSSETGIKTFSSTGTLLNSVNLGAGWGYRHCVTPLADGGAAVVFGKVGGGTALAIINSSGVQQGSTVTVHTDDPLRGDYDHMCKQLANGNIVVQASGIGQYCGLYLYTSSGTFIKSNLTWSGNTDSNLIYNTLASMDITGNTITLGMRSNSNVDSVMQLNATLDITTARIGLNRAGSGIRNVGVSDAAMTYAWNMGSVGYILVRYASDSGSSLHIAGMNASGFVGTEQNPLYEGANASWNMYVMMHSSGTVLAAGTGSGQSGVNVYFYSTGRKTPLGVVIEPASAGSSVRVATKGSYALNLDFGAGGSFDGRSSTPFGSKGAIAGSQAILFGLS